MQSGNGNATLKHPALSIYTIGIASLVLEGRIISTDEDDEGFKVSTVQTAEVIDSNDGDDVNDVNDVNDVDDVETEDSSDENPVSKTSVMQRISEKLWSLRQIPGVNSEIIETSIAIPLQSHDDTYEHYHSRPLNANFNRNLTRLTMPTAPPSPPTSSSATSVLHDIDVDWNDTSILYNGLEKIQMPTSPIKLQSQHSFRNTSNPMARHHEQVLKMYKNKEKCGNGSSSSPSKPKQGPHCEQFLKNICVIKVEPVDDIDHVCNHISSYVSNLPVNFPNDPCSS